MHESSKHGQQKNPLRSDGTSERRGFFVMDKQGLIRYIDIHDINERPKLEVSILKLGQIDK